MVIGMADEVSVRRMVDVQGSFSGQWRYLKRVLYALFA